MSKIHKTCLKSNYNYYNAIARATRIFSELDINGDGELTCDEFIRGCMQVKIVNTHIA